MLLLRSLFDLPKIRMQNEFSNEKFFSSKNQKESELTNLSDFKLKMVKNKNRFFSETAFRLPAK